MKRIVVSALAALLLSPSLKAIPALQLYIEGATYDSATETWSASGNSTVRLWTVGNVGAYGTIYDVKLSIAYSMGDKDTAQFNVVPSSTGNLGGFTDNSIAPAWESWRRVTDGSVPKLYDGRNLPAHGEYGANTAWDEYLLGDFTLTDSPIADFINNFPTPTSHLGQINVYEITFTGTDLIHFDLYNHVQSRNKGKSLRAETKDSSVFAPFSHDASGGSDSSVPPDGFQVPDGGTTVALLGLGVLSLVGIRKRIYR